MNLFSRALYDALGQFIMPIGQHERGLIKAHDAKALILMQTQVLGIALGLLVWVAFFAAEKLSQIASICLAIGVVWLYTCVGAKLVFRFKGAQQAKEIFRALLLAQVVKFLLVIAFCLWAMKSPYIEAATAMISLGLMQVLPLISGIVHAKCGGLYPADRKSIINSNVTLR